MRVDEAVAGPTRQPDWQDARLLERFWFDADAQWAPIGLLSGGERRRLQLVLVLRARPNVLLLDEPTNDLDLDTLRVLEDFLEDWPGALVVVSHDRAFLERTVADVLVIDDGTPGGGCPAGTAAGRRARRARAGRAARPAPAAPPPPAPARRPGRSPSTLRRLLREAEKEIADPRRAGAIACRELAAAGADHQAMARLGPELAAVEAELAAAEERWLALGEELEVPFCPLRSARSGRSQRTERRGDLTGFVCQLNKRIEWRHRKTPDGRTAACCCGRCTAAGRLSRADLAKLTGLTRATRLGGRP